MSLRLAVISIDVITNRLNRKNGAFSRNPAICLLTRHQEHAFTITIRFFEYCAKHKSVNEKNRSYKSNSNIIIDPPAFPHAGQKLIESIGSAVGSARGYHLSYIEYARLMGKATSTTSYWFGVATPPHLVCCFCLLEQLTPGERHEIVDKLCRDLPIIDHPKLGHNPITVGILKNLLNQNAGLTLITGSDDEQRTFLLNALGQSFCRIDRSHRKPAGLDMHEPSWFVPVETLSYLRESRRPLEILEAIRKLWPSIRNTKRPLVLLNGIWSVAPEFRKEIIALANRRHVIVADKEINLPAKPILKSTLPVHVISVRPSPKNEKWLELTFQLK